MKAVLFYLFLLISFYSTAQINYTGRYGYFESRQSLMKRFPGISKDESGFVRSLVLLKLNENRYKFWLYVCRGYKSYNSGQAEGIINVEKDSAVFSEHDSSLLIDCKLYFHFYPGKVVIEQTEGNCGFGGNVVASGDYPKTSSMTPTSKNIADNYQFEVSKYKIASGKATIYEKPVDSLPTKQYFISGDLVYGYYEENGFVYIQHVTKKGKYIEGWLKKSDLQLWE